MPKVPDENTARQALNHVQSFKSDTWRLNEDQRDNFVEWFEMYSLKDRRREIEPWLSNLQITGAFEFVERPFAIMTANTPSFELEATDLGAPMIELEPEVLDEDGVVVIKDALRVDFKEIYEADLGAMFKVRKMKRILREMVKGMLIYGTYHAEVTKEVVKRDEYSQLFDDGEEEIDFVDIIDKITPDVSLVEPYDVLVSPYARDPEDAIERFGGYGVVRNNVSLRELDPDVYFNLDELETTISAAGDQDMENTEKINKDQVVSANSSGGEGTAGTFNVSEIWCYFKLDSEPYGKEKKYIISEANGVLIRFEEVADGDESPFTVLKNQEVPGQYWGIGEIEPIHSDLIEENTIRNQRIDYDNRILNEEWLLRSDSGIDPRQLVSKPHNIIVGDDIGDGSIRQVLRTTSPLAASGQDMDRIRRNMATTTGSIDTIATGGVGNVTNTATGERIREQNAIARYAAKMENVEFAVADIARKMLKIKADGLSDSDKVPVFLRGKWREVDAKLYKELIDKYIVRVRAGSMNIKNSVTERNDRIATINIALQAAQVLGPDSINFEDLYRDLLGTFSDVDVDKVLPKKLLNSDQTNQTKIPQGLPAAINELGKEEDNALEQPVLEEPELTPEA